MDSFLGLLGRDTSPIGRRDAAFFLCRLNLGVPLRSLQQLRWEQIEQAQPDVWVRWSQSGHRLLLPPHLWGAIQAYLQVSGRCSGMCPGKYIFAPQVQPVLPGSGARPEDWLEMHYLSDSSLQRVLKLYGRQLGISDDRLTLSAMRRTAIRLQLDQGADLEAMRSFLDTREKIKSTRYRLARFPLLPPGDSSDAQGNLPPVPLPPVPLPPRTSTPLKGDEGFIHGYYSRHKDRQAVEAIMAEAISGVDQEIACLKRMLRHVLELQGDEIRKAEVYIESARRLGELVVAARQAHDQPADTWADEFLSCLDAIDPDRDGPPLSQRIKLQVMGLSSDQPGSSSGLGEEVATIRLILRNINDRLEQGVPAHEYLRLVDLYSHGCLRLLRLLKLDGGDYSGRLERYVRAHINEAIRRLQQEYAEQRARTPPVKNL